MEFQFKQIKEGNSIIYILKYFDFNPADFLAELSDQDLNKYHQFSHVKRKREFVATRILKNQIWGPVSIHYSSIGAPFIPSEGFISISHAQNTVAIVNNPNYAVGIDLEKKDVKARKLHLKFLNEKEKKIFNLASDREMTLCWSAKECMYKLAGRKKIDFKKDLHLKKESDSILIGTIQNPSEQIQVKIRIFEFEDFILTMNCEENKILSI